MEAAMEGRKPRLTFSMTIRTAIVSVSLCLAFVGMLSFAKSKWLGNLANESLESLHSRHSRSLSLFQASFYFFYEDQFLPGIRELQKSSDAGPAITRIEILSDHGFLLFDSALPPAGVVEPKPYSDPAVVSRITHQSTP